MNAGQRERSLEGEADKEKEKENTSGTVSCNSEPKKQTYKSELDPLMV